MHYLFRPLLRKPSFQILSMAMLPRPLACGAMKRRYRPALSVARHYAASAPEQPAGAPRSEPNSSRMSLVEHAGPLAALDRLGRRFLHAISPAGAFPFSVPDLRTRIEKLRNPPAYV